jgi:hypothetical protein
LEERVDSTRLALAALLDDVQRGIGKEIAKKRRRLKKKK